MKKILSLDGGGIRGIIPSMILMEIESRTGKRIAELFDLIGGTSTGGILSLGLTKPDANRQPQYAAKELLQLYETRGNDIFSRPAWKQLLPLGNVFGPKYSASGLEKLLKEYFGEAQLSDAITQLVITSYDVQHRQSHFFKSHKASASADRDFLMRDVARSTSAAPTYFPPNRLNMAGTTGDYYALVDGGVFANNPAMCAYVEAKSIYKDEKDFLVVSVGTGENAKRLDYDKVKRWGLLSWAQPVIEVVFDGINDTIDYQLSQLMPMTGDDKRYYRFQITLNGVREDLDDCTPENIRGLKSLGEELIHRSNAEIDAVCELLKK